MFHQGIIFGNTNAGIAGFILLFTWKFIVEIHNQAWELAIRRVLRE